MFSRRSDLRWMFTPSVKRLVMTNAVVLVLLFIVFNGFTITVIDGILTSNLDRVLHHEMQKIVADIRVNEDTVYFADYRELNEHDFREATGNPFFLRLYEPNGKIIARSQNLSLFPPIPYSLSSDFSPGEGRNLDAGKHRLREIRHRVADRNGNLKAIVQLSCLETESADVVNQTIRLNAVIFPVVFVLMVIISAFMARKSLLPLYKITTVAENITVGDLDTRIAYDAEPHDIFGRLRDTLNSLIDRLSLQIRHMGQFADNASHQLLNPLTAIRSELDYSLKKERSSSEYRETLALIHRQTVKMTEIINTLLMISKTSRDTSIKSNIFNVSAALQKSCSEFTAREVQTGIPAAPIYVKGVAMYFSLIVENLLDNAAKYSTPDTSIKVRLWQEQGNVFISVEDSGIGVRDEEKETVFTRFYRGSKSERFGISGYGLGLSLVKTIVDMMDGGISVSDNSPVGSVFTLRFPVIREM